jgi:hypothetical protein
VNIDPVAVPVIAFRCVVGHDAFCSPVGRVTDLQRLTTYDGQASAFGGTPTCQGCAVDDRETIHTVLEYSNKRKDAATQNAVVSLGHRIGFGLVHGALL